MNQTITTPINTVEDQIMERRTQRTLSSICSSLSPLNLQQINNLVNNIGIGIGIRIRIGVGIRPINLDLDEVEGEQFEDAIKSGLDNFGIAGFESENDRLEDGIDFERREAEERRLVEIGGVTYGFELVQDGFAEMHLQISTNIYIYIIRKPNLILQMTSPPCRQVNQPPPLQIHPNSIDFLKYRLLSLPLSQNPSLIVGGYKESHINKRDIGSREEADLRGKR